MNILHVSHLYHPSIGGNQLHVQLMSERLVELKENVTVFTPNAWDVPDFFRPIARSRLLLKKELINGVQVRRFPVDYKFAPFVSKKLFKIRGGYRLFQHFYKNSEEFLNHGPVTFGMLPSIRSLKPDIMLATNNYYFTTYLCALAKKKYSIKFVLMPITHVAQPWASNACLKFIFDQADLVIACTEFEKKFLISQGVDPFKIKALALGIHCENFQGADGRKVRKKYHFKDGPVVAYLGRKVPHKGIETLINAMRFVWKEFPEAQLLLAGQKEEYFVPTLQKYIDQYTQEEKAKLINIDDFPAEEKNDFFDAIDILAMPSNTDCFGLVYLEAWACGKPVIACTNTPQETIITHGHDGLLIEYQNVQGLAEAIKKILKDPQLKKTMGNNGLESVKRKYNLDSYGENLREEYYKLLKK